MLDVVVIGGGQAGLAAGYHLKRAQLNFKILDAAERVGDGWRQRYDSLVLFTPAKRNALPGLPFPGHPEHYPHKDEVADYLELYARTFELPVELGARVQQVQPQGNTFEVETSPGQLTARAVLVTTGPFQAPYVPPFAHDLDASVVQVHSSAYRNPRQLPPGPVMVVGSGNSGAQIAAELTRTHDVTLALGQRQPYLPQRPLGRDIFDWLAPLRFTEIPARSRLGKLLQRRDPLIGTNVRGLARGGHLKLTSRVIGVSGRGLHTADGQVHEVNGVVWATGFQPKYPWLRVPVLGDDGRPVHENGVTRVPGVYFLGLPWQRSRGSALLGGVGRDAEWIARHVSHYVRSTQGCKDRTARRGTT